MGFIVGAARCALAGLDAHVLGTLEQLSGGKTAYVDVNVPAAAAPGEETEEPLQVV